MNKAIKLAIEKGGYKSESLSEGDRAYCPYGIGDISLGYSGRIYITKLRKNGEPGRKLQYWNMNEAVLDPLFWQALGKALGWEKYRQPRKKNLIGLQDDWIVHAYDYLAIRLTGGDEEKFWKELLK